MAPMVPTLSATQLSSCPSLSTATTSLRTTLPTLATLAALPPPSLLLLHLVAAARFLTLLARMDLAQSVAAVFLAVAQLPALPQVTSRFQRSTLPSLALPHLCLWPASLARA